MFGRKWKTATLDVRFRPPRGSPVPYAQFVSGVMGGCWYVTVRRNRSSGVYRVSITQITLTSPASTVWTCLELNLSISGGGRKLQRAEAFFGTAREKE